MSKDILRRSVGRCLSKFFFLLLLSTTAMMLLAASVVVESKTNDDDRVSAVDDKTDDSMLLPWQRCSFFVAPTTATKNGGSMNWGVYANRDFSKGEIVDISPLTIPIEDGSQAIERSILNDYVYGYWRVFEHPQIKGKHSISRLYSVLFGPDMFYNHHPVAPNVEFVTFGREPEAVVPDAVNPQGFVANRRIRRGEEIFSSYNGKEDGGTEWFRRRGISMETPPSFSGSPLGDILDRQIYSGLGQPSWKNRLLPLLPKEYDLPFSIDLKWLAPSFDAGLGDARTKIDVQRGERLEISTALVLSKKFTKGTALMPLAYSWTDLHEDHRKTLRNLSENDHLHLQYQGPDTSWKPINNFSNGQSYNDNFEDLVLFPVAGNIGMVRRRSIAVDDSDSGDSSEGSEVNCRLVVHPPASRDVDFVSNNDDDIDDWMLWLDHPVGVTIELIATEDMDAGTILVVDLLESVATHHEYMLLFRELKQTGQPFAKEIFRDRRSGQEQTKPKGGRRHRTTNSRPSLEEL